MVLIQDCEVIQIFKLPIDLQWLPLLSYLNKMAAISSDATRSHNGRTDICLRILWVYDQAPAAITAFSDKGSREQNPLIISLISWLAMTQNTNSLSTGWRRKMDRWSKLMLWTHYYTICISIYVFMYWFLRICATFGQTNKQKSRIKYYVLAKQNERKSTL